MTRLLGLPAMRPRDPAEPGRVSSPLELFFDLVFAVAVSTAAQQLHHALTEGHVAHALTCYLTCFFAIWWAWMNFTWFATSFDSDDWLYRVLTFVQMGGVLVVAAGVEPVFDATDFRLVVVGYVIMRVAMIAQWVRAAIQSPELRRTTLTYAVGILVIQLVWITTLAVPPSIHLAVAGLGALAEIAIPVVAERRRAGRTPWHPHHITERYGLFTLIVLGESLLASSNAVIAARGDHQAVAPLVEIGVLAFTTTACLWWLYFWPPHHRAIGALGQSLLFGYGHFFLFAAAGALSAGIEIFVDAQTGATRLGPLGQGLSFALPVAVFMLVALVALVRFAGDRIVSATVLGGAVLVMVAGILPVPEATTCAVLVAVVVVLAARPARH